TIASMPSTSSLPPARVRVSVAGLTPVARATSAHVRPRASRSRSSAAWSARASKRRTSRLLPEDEEDRAAETERGPEVVEPHRLAHVERRERHEHREGDHFLEDLQLPETEHGVTDAVRRNLDQVLEERDAPARERGDDPRTPAQVLQVRVPGEGHEHV